MESAFALALTAGIKGVAMVMDPEAQPLTSDPTRGRVIIGNHVFNFVLFCVGFLILCMVAIAFAFVSFPNYLLFCFFLLCVSVSSFRFSVSSFVCSSAAPLLCFLISNDFNGFLFLCLSAS